MTNELDLLVKEIERRWRERTPANCVLNLEPESRVNRSEMTLFAEQNGLKIPILDDEYDRAVFQLFDRLRKEFPNEKWDTKKNRSAGTIRRRKELGM